MESHALDALNSALELTTHDPDPEIRAQVIMDLPAVAIWMRLAGRQLYTLAKQSTDPSVDATGVRLEFLVGLSIERWTLWRKSL